MNINKRIFSTKNIIYSALLVLFAVLILVGYLYITSDGGSIVAEDATVYARAKVVEITRVENTLSDDGETGEFNIYFTAELIGGKHSGQIIQAMQNNSAYTPFNPREVRIGDEIVVGNFGVDSLTSFPEWNFVEHVRSDALIILLAFFVILLIAFGRKKGLKTVYSLALTLLAVFFVFLPAVILGKNIYLWAILVCVYITVMTLCTVNGISPMSLAAMLGCCGGVLVSSAIMLITDIVINLSGYTDSHSIYLLYIGGGIDLKALIYGAVIIGSVGAVMDVSVDISASLKEISAKVRTPSFRELWTSGLNIGRDVIGTMSNTLVLAYIGGSMCSLLLYIYNLGGSPIYLFNLEPIIVELLKILVGSYGILLTLPLTSLICAYLYTRPKMLSAILAEHDKEVSSTAKIKGEDEYALDEFSLMLEKEAENEKK